MRGKWLIFAAGMAAGGWILAGAPGTASESEAPASTPQAFLDFCAREPAECESQLAAKPLRMNAARWLTAQTINSQVNAEVRAADDSTLFQEPEHWAVAGKAGDCEDYVLLKRRLLRQAGFPDAALLITIVRDERNEGHAVLTLATPEGDFILDNRRDRMLSPAATGYRFIKRQSTSDPMRWVSLADSQTPEVASTRN